MVKRSHRRIGVALIALLISCGAAWGPAYGQSTSVVPGPFTGSPQPLEPEAPVSLFSAKLGGADAELLVHGSWEADATATAGIQIPPGGGLQLSSAQPLLFNQRPDLFLSFLLFKKLFVEARVSDDPTLARYAVGYRGGEGELLQEVRVGNDKISFPTLPFLSLGDGSYQSFGAAARIESGDFQGRAMVRYDQADRVTKRFVGSSEVTDTVLTASTFIAGRYFATYSRPAANLVLFVQSTSGALNGSDGNVYRQMDSGEYSYSAATGFISLVTAASTRVLAYYSGSGNPAQGTTVSVSGLACDLLYDPNFRNADGTLDPKLQMLGRYSTVADPNTSEVFVRNTAETLKDSSFQARVDSSGFVEITRAGGAATPGTSSTPDKSYLQPFRYKDSAGTVNDPNVNMPWLYATDFSTTGTKTYAPVYTREIVVRNYQPSAYITLDKDVVSGSVTVTRNGVPDYAFSVDTDNGRLLLATPPGLSEEIVVSYLRDTAERRSGSLAAALGGFWKLGDDQDAYAALGTRWSVPGTSYAAGGASNPGTVTLTAGEKKTGGDFRHDLAVAAIYTQEEASGRYRMEGMESASPYVTSFISDSTPPPTGFVLEEIADTLLANNFSTFVSQMHSDGSTQMALHMVAANLNAPGLAVPATGTTIYDFGVSKVEVLPPYQNFKTFAFFIYAPLGVVGQTVTLAVDNSTVGNNFISVTVPLGSLGSGWNKILVHYGSGDSQVYLQTSENASAVPLSGAVASFNTANETYSRVHITTSGFTANQVVWIDEIILEDSVGQSALAFQGNLAYTDAKFLIGSDAFPLVQGLAVKADASAAFQNGSFAAGGGSLATSLGPLGIGVHARGSVNQAAAATLSGGHELTLPAEAFPVRLTDKFDFDPSLGAFGREDLVSVNAGQVANLDLSQSTTWTPPPSDEINGILTQEWGAKLGLAGGHVTTGLTASNRAQPTLGPGTSGNYASAWLGSFAYALPAFQSESEQREESGTMSLLLRPDAELASASLSTTAEPQDAGNPLRTDSGTARIAAPLEFGHLRLTPYYKRAWDETRTGTGSGFQDDASLALSDIASTGILYSGIPFAELVDSRLPALFADETAPSGVSLSEASYKPEAGVILARDFGSSWYDLITPSAMSFAFRRELTRESDVVTDAAVWDTTAKFAAVNVFGSLGAYPSGLPFDSDEYFATLQATITKISGESTDRYSLQSQNLATLYAGSADSFTAENRISLSFVPGDSTWSESLRFVLSTRIERHWLLDLYRMIVIPKPAPGPAQGASAAETPAAPGGGNDANDDTTKISLVSLYLEDLATRQPNLRSDIELDIAVSGSKTDAEAPGPTWSLGESWQTKLTVPERLTVTAKVGLDQSRDGLTNILSFDLTLSLGVIVSF